MIQVKNDPPLLIFSAVLLIATFALIAHGDVTWKEGAAFILGALALPGLFGRKEKADGLESEDLKDDDDPPPPTIGAALVCVGLVILNTTACSTTASRAQARGAVLATAEAVKIADATCAKQALERTDLHLARQCQEAYASARSSLLIASAGVDAWDEGKRGDVTCAVVHAASDLSRTVSEFKARQIPIPLIVDDSLRLARGLGGCHE